jgi:colanic acid/amylovoran biosynthesis glycosyltransferase
VRIVYVTTSLPYGAGESFIVPEIMAMRRLGHDLLVVPTIPRGSMVHGRCREIERLTVCRELFSPGVVAAALGTMLKSPIRCAKAAREVTGSRPLKPTLRSALIVPKGLWLAAVARRWRADHIHAHWATAPASVAMIASAVSGISWSFTAHRYDIRRNDVFGRKSRHASFVRFISKSGVELARRMGIGSVTNGCVIHMGVEIPDHRHRPSTPARPVILCVARLVPIKGHAHLLEALSILGEKGIRPSLLLAGDGSLREDLERLVMKRGLGGQVQFLGQLPHERVLELYRESPISCSVLPSVELGPGEHEGIPVALVEAMARGVPVVSTETGGIPELVTAGTGILVPAGDPPALAAGIARVLLDEDLGDRLGREAARSVGENFSVETTSRDLARRFERASQRGRIR